MNDRERFRFYRRTFLNKIGIWATSAECGYRRNGGSPQAAENPALYFQITVSTHDRTSAASIPPTPNYSKIILRWPSPQAKVERWVPETEPRPNYKFKNRQYGSKWRNANNISQVTVYFLEMSLFGSGCRLSENLGPTFRMWMLAVQKE